jgi:hypothetical protein
MITASACVAPLPLITSLSTDSPVPHQSERSSRTRRNVGEPDKYWPQHSTLKIAMYDFEMDEPYVLAVKKAASEWLPHINLKFEFVSGEEGDVRITQNPPGDESGVSRIGIDAHKGRPWAATMSLPMDASAPSFAHTVLHEFGHMLGAHHEHQHPDANIPWDRASLDRHFTQQQLEHTFLPLPRSNTYDFLPYDEDSAMHYSINPALTTDNTFHSKNSMLSNGDIAWARKAYPRASSQARPIF